MFSKVARQEEDFPPKKKRKSFGYSEEWKIIKTVWDVFGFHVSYTRELFPAELNAPAPRTVSSLPFFYSVQYSMERKSTKRRLNRP